MRETRTPDDPERRSDALTTSARRLADELRELEAGVHQLSDEAAQASSALAEEAKGLLQALSSNELRIHRLSDEGFEHASRLAEQIRRSRIQAWEDTRGRTTGRTRSIHEEGKERSRRFAQEEQESGVERADRLRDEGRRLADQLGGDPIVEKDG